MSSNFGDSRRCMLEFPPVMVNNADARVPLVNLSAVRVRMDSLHQFLSDSVNRNTLINKDQMEMVSSEIVSAIHQIIVNGAALLACFQSPMRFSAAGASGEKPSEPSDLKLNSNKLVELENMKVEKLEEDLKDESDDEEGEIIELDEVELLAEHIHFCEICGKGFKRDANVRMHMRAHGNQFKTPEALAKPEKNCEPVGRKMRFSCPYVGCNRNKAHKKFRPLKSAISVKNHFKRSHCPKMYSCNRCNKKSFSIVADLKSHLKHCGEAKWKCSCGTTFSRKDKLFGHMALFEGHMPAVVEETDEKSKGVIGMDEDDGEVRINPKANSSDDAFFDRLIEGFDSLDSYSLKDMLGSPIDLSTGRDMDGFYDF